MRVLSLPEMCLLARQFVDLGGQQNAFGGNAGDNVTDSEMVSYFNLEVPEVWALLTSKFPENYYFRYYNIPIASGVSVYPLPADFKAILGVDAAFNSAQNNWFTILPYNIHERNQYSNYIANPVPNATWSNIRYQLQDGNISFTPNLASLPGAMRLSYQYAAPILCATLPAAYATATVYAQGALIYVPLTATNGVQTNQVFLALNAGTSGGSAPPWLVPGTVSDNGILWAYKGPLSIFQTEFDGISGWEQIPILSVAIRCGLKQEMDCSSLMAQKQALLARIDAEAANRTAGDPQCVTPGFGMMEGNFGQGGFGGWGGGW